MTQETTRAELLKGLYKPIAQPHVETFAECFPDWEPWRLFDKAYKPRFGPRYVEGQNIAGNLYKGVKAIFKGEKHNRKHPDERMAVGPFCSRRDGASMAVRCADWVLSRIKEGTIVIGDDRMSFEIVDHDNGYSLVIAQHGQICGSVWLAYIRTDSIPNVKEPLP